MNPRMALVVRWILGILAAWFGVATLILGGLLHMYARYWWWDDMLHCVSGILLAAIGVLIVRATHRRQLPPLLFTVGFGFCFALALGVLWEIYEFNSDIFFHTAMQQWNMPPQAIVMGISRQGMGLRDTMSDLINATIGAFVTSLGIVAISYRRLAILHEVLGKVLPRRLR